MWTGDYDRKKLEEREERKKEKPKKMQPFELSGEMSILLPNGVRIEISSKKNPLVVVTKDKGWSEIQIREEYGKLGINIDTKINIGSEKVVSKNIILE